MRAQPVVYRSVGAYPFCRCGRIFRRLEKRIQGQINDIREIILATGACYFFQKRCLKMNRL